MTLRVHLALTFPRMTCALNAPFWACDEIMRSAPVDVFIHFIRAVPLCASGI